MDALDIPLGHFGTWGQRWYSLRLPAQASEHSSRQQMTEAEGTTWLSWKSEPSVN